MVRNYKLKKINRIHNGMNCILEEIRITKCFTAFLQKNHKSVSLVCNRKSCRQSQANERHNRMYQGYFGGVLFVAIEVILQSLFNSL